MLLCVFRVGTMADANCGAEYRICRSFIWSLELGRIGEVSRSPIPS